MELTGKRVLVIGSGASGIASMELLQRKVHDRAARDVALWKEKEAGYGADRKKSIGHRFRGKRDCLNGALAEKRSPDSPF